MLDGHTATLLRRINDLCAGGKYEIIEESDLIEGANMESESLQKTVEYLAENGYIDLKYAQNGVYCVCPLPDGRLYAERLQKKRTDNGKRRKEIVLLTALGAFFGALIGSLIAGGIFLLGW